MRLKKRPRSRRLNCEALEPRVVLSAPEPVAGAPFVLPQDGSWRNTPIIGAPVFADLNGDGRDELIAAAAGGRLVAYTQDASGKISVFQTYETGAEANFKSTPIVVDRGDGTKVIVAGLGRDESAARGGANALEDGRVFAFNATTGQVLPGWPVSTLKNNAGESGVVGPLASGDLDGDGVPEIVVTSFSHTVTAIKLDGTVLWRYDNDDTVQSGAVVGDIDRDGKNEVIFGGDAGFLTPDGKPGGFINILNNNGAAEYRISTPEVIWSSPTLVDLNGDGNLEIVVGTGLFNALNSPSPASFDGGNKVYAYDYQGNLVPGWPYRTTTDTSLSRAVYSSPAVADLNGDGDFETVVIDRGGYLHVIQPDGTALPGFAGGVFIGTGNPPGADPGGNSDFATPVLADVNGDGKTDIVASYLGEVAAFDASGNRLWTLSAPGGEQLFSAPAIGQFDGSGGLELAFVSIGGANNRPRSVSVDHLDPSGTAPAWPMMRKTASGRAVAQNPAFLEKYIRASFRALVGSEATDQNVADFKRMILDGDLTISQLAQDLAATPLSRSIVVKRLYQTYLDRQPTQQELDAGTQALANGFARDLAQQLVTSQEFYDNAGNTDAGVVHQLWKKILRRDLNATEAAAFIPLVQNGIAKRAQIANLLLQSEEFTLLDTVVPVVLAYRTEFPNTPFGADNPAGVATVLLNKEGRVPEAQIRAGLVSSGGNYQYTSTIASYIASVYRDVLGREATQPEVAGQLRQFASGAQGPKEFARNVILSPEGKAVFAREQYQKLLGRQPTPQEISAAQALPSRDEIVIAIAASDEYDRKNGGTNTSVVIAAATQLGGLTGIDASNPLIQQLVAMLNQGTSRADVLRQFKDQTVTLPNGKIIGYYEAELADLLMRYVPNEAEGVLRTGLQGNPATGPSINPDPAKLNALIQQRKAGTSESDILIQLLTSSDYLSKVAYNRGIYQKPGVRV